MGGKRSIREWLDRFSTNMLSMNSLQMQLARWSEALSRHQSGIRTFAEAMFSLNVAYAVGYAVFLYISRSQMSWVPESDLGYYLLRSAVRIDDLLGASSTAAVSTDAVARSDFPIHRIGLELTFSVTIVAAALLIFLLVRLCRRTSGSWVTTERVAGGIALFLAPACYLAMSGLTWKWAMFPEDSPAVPFWRSGLLAIFIAEFLTVSIFVSYRRRPLAAPLTISFLIAHYVLWTLFLWPVSPILMYQLSAPRIVLSAFPLSGIAWLLSLRAGSAPFKKNTRAAWGRMFAAGSVVLVLLLVLWLPARQDNLAACRDMDALTIKMARGPCRGSCPQYTLIIHGNGAVEYDGAEFVNAKGHHEGKISNEQLIRVLQSLDNARFSALEDRAFAWCFDSSSVAVWAVIGGRTKRVISDGGCVGARSGPQYRFVQATREIDLAVGIDQWVLCDGHSCQR
jgi:Domain of unknown function (DUF6438)